MITRKFGMAGLQPDHLTVRLRGSAGQSLGAFAVQGLKLEVFGDANDYVGKGLSGGTIVVRPAVVQPAGAPSDNAIIGNTVLYGATAGKLFAAGRAGERFAVRNSGADAVVEGCGSNGCEYMTGGVAVILGPVGDNFGAGMTGGMAFVYDPDDAFELKVNPETRGCGSASTIRTGKACCRTLVEEHVAETKSPLGARLLNDWDREVERFWQVVPEGDADAPAAAAVDGRSEASVSQCRPERSEGPQAVTQVPPDRHEILRSAQDDKQIPRIAWLQLAANIILFGLSWPIIKIGLEAIDAAVVRGRARHAVGHDRLRPAGRARPPGMAASRRLADRAVGRRAAAHLLLRLLQSRRAERAGRPLGRARLHRPCSGSCRCRCWSAKRSAGAPSPASCSASLGIVVLVDPLRFDWSDQRRHLRAMSGCCWRASPGRIAIVHIRRHRWRLTPLDVLPWQMSVATVLLWILALVARARGLSRLQPGRTLDVAALYRRASPVRSRPGPRSRSARALPPVIGSIGMLGVPLLSIASSVVLLGEPITCAAGARHDAGDRGHRHRDPGEGKMNWGMMSRAERDAAYNNSDAVKNSAELNAARIAASAAFRKAHPKHLDLRYGPKERNAWDLFPAADPNAPCLVFIHGGYWQRNSRTSSPA